MPGWKTADSSSPARGGRSPRGDDDLLRAVFAGKDHIHKLLLHVVRAGCRLVRIRQPQDFHQNLLRRFVFDVNAELLILGNAVSLQVRTAYDNLRADVL